LLDDQGIDVLDGRDMPSSSGMKEVKAAMEKYPDVRYRYLMAPSLYDIKDFDFLNFSHKNTAALFEAGKFDGRKVMNLGAGARFAQLKDLFKPK